MKTEFRKLKNEEADTAYQVICDAVEWLESKGIRQWTVPLPRSIWEQRQHNGDNYALICDGDLAVVLSLIEEAHPYWKDELGCDEHCWLSTVTTAADYRGQQLGRRAVAEAAAFLRDKGAKEMCVDCVHGNGFLPKYYDSLNFRLVGRKEIEYPVGTFDMVLMKKNL